MPVTLVCDPSSSRQQGHAAFEALLPPIERHARIAFRHLLPEARSEAVEETLCQAYLAYLRLVEQNKTDAIYPTTLARFAVRRVRSGRQVGGRINGRDVASQHCQRKHQIVLERLDAYTQDKGEWEQIVVQDRRAGPAETAAMRIDFGCWLGRLPRQRAEIARYLAKGETTAAAAKRFHVSSARISQLRRQLHLAWQRFQGEPTSLPAVA